MWKRELWQSGWLERSFVWQRGPCHILVKAFSVFPQTLISRLEKYGTGRTWRWMTRTKHRCVTAFSSLDPLLRVTWKDATPADDKVCNCFSSGRHKLHYRSFWFACIMQNKTFFSRVQFFAVSSFHIHASSMPSSVTCMNCFKPHAKCMLKHVHACILKD